MSSNEDFGQSSEDPHSPPKAEEAISQEATTKKKKFQPLKQLKKLFAGKKRTKAKDGDEAPRARSAESILQPEEGEQSSLSKKHSMSDDSVFSSGKPRDSNPDELAKSLEALPHADFKNELARKIRHRRGDEEDLDDGLPQSPHNYTTVDALEDNQNKGFGRELGDRSMDSEVGQDFFQPMASGSSLKPGHQSDPGSDVDLDAIPQGSTTNLANQYAYHKLSVKPKKPGRTSRSPGSSSSTATSPVPGGVQVLPFVSEEEKPAVEDETPDEDYDMDPSSEELLGENKVVSTKLHPESQTSSAQDITVVDKENDTLQEVQGGVKKAEVTTKAEYETKKPEMETREAEIELTIVEKSPEVSREGDEQSPSMDNNSDSNDVVMRKNRKTGAELDLNKRQTIATETESTPFGERRKRASLIVETKKWDNLDKQKENQEEEAEATGGSEFAKMFNKFQRKSVKHPSSDEENVAKRLVFPSKSSTKMDSTPTTLSSVENRYDTKTNNKFIIEEKKKTVDIPVKDSSPLIVIEKTADDDRKNSTPKKNISVKKTVKINDKEDTKSKVKQAPIANPSAGISAKTVTIELSKPETTETQAPPPATSSKYVVHKNEKDTANVTKDKATEEVTVRNEKSKDSFKRDSPRIRNRDRSQTLPEQPVPKNVISAASSPSVKRTASSVTAKEAKEEVRPTSQLSPIRSSTKRPEPKKLQIPASNAGGGPSWIAMARKKTTGWNEDTDKEIEKKESKSGSAVAEVEDNALVDSCSEEAKGSHRKSVMDMAKKYQKLPVS